METGEFLETCGPAVLMFAVITNKKDPDLNRAEGKDQDFRLSSDLCLQGLAYSQLALNSQCSQNSLEHPILLHPPPKYWDLSGKVAQVRAHATLPENYQMTCVCQHAQPSDRLKIYFDALEVYY